jgi:hypothetical protein
LSRVPSAERAKTCPPIRNDADTVIPVNWDDVDPSALFASIRDRGPVADAERTVWAFERALVAARVDPVLLEHLLVACVSLVSYERGQTPRTVLEQVFRRAVSDEEWRDRFAPLIG